MSLEHLSFPGSHCNSLGSHCVSPSSHGRSLGHGGWSGVSTSGGAGSSVSKAKVGKAGVKAMGKEKAVEDLEEESASGSEVEDDEGTSGGEGA